MYSRDQPLLRRRELLLVTLSDKKELNLQTWRVFQSSFELAVSRVGDATDVEIEIRLSSISYL